MLRVAHRGASGYEPENTLKSFKKALSLGADMLELDVRVSKDGFIVVIHDKKVDRITNGQGKVNTLTLHELQQLDAGSGQTISTLDEVLDLVQGKAKINIDLKEDKAVPLTLQLIEKYVTKKLFSYDDFLISAFKPSILRSIKKQNKYVGVCFNFITLQPFFLILSKLMGMKYIKPQKRLITPEFVHIAHTLGFLVLAWTINSKEDVEKMRSCHVDGIITDYPDILH